MSLVAGAASLASFSAAAEKPLNIMFMVVDDLRIQLNSYGFPQMKTPNFDRLAEMGMQFNRAYVQQAVCAASRASFLTGCRPDSTGVDYPYTPWFNEVFRRQHPSVAEHFTRNGYYTRTFGKIHHGPDDRELSEPHFKDPCYQFALPEHQNPDEPMWKADTSLPPWEHADLPDSAYSDGQIADETIATLRRAVRQDKPFFLLPGFKKPHLPFVAPKKYYDLYADTEIQLAPHPKLGANQREFTVTSTTGASKWWVYPEKGIDNDNARQLIRSYSACVSFVDAQIGEILDELEALGLMDSTLIIVCSDHGWHLGDHGMWGKSTNFEWSTLSPLFVYAPGMKDAGRQTDALVEYVDLYPTMLQAAGLEIPDYLEGTSLMPLLDDAGKPWKRAAFSQFPRSPQGLGPMEGYSIRTKDFRYTQWRKDRGAGEVVFEELYDNRSNMLEADNVAEHAEFRAVLEEHRAILAEGWKKALPPGMTTRSDLPRGDDSWYSLSKKEQTVERAKGTGETSENKPWIARYFEKHPEADTNRDGILTLEEANAHRGRNK